MWENEDEYFKTVLLTADKFYAELKTRQDALLFRTPLMKTVFVHSTPEEMAADMAAVAPQPTQEVHTSLPDAEQAALMRQAPPPKDIGDWGAEEPPDEEVREGMATTGLGTHNSQWWEGTDIRCPSCGKATLVRNTGQSGPTMECSTRQGLKTEQINPKTGKNVWASVGPCSFQQWPDRNWD